MREPNVDIIYYIVTIIILDNYMDMNEQYAN